VRREIVRSLPTTLYGPPRLYPPLAEIGWRFVVSLEPRSRYRASTYETGPGSFRDFLLETLSCAGRSIVLAVQAPVGCRRPGRLNQVEIWLSIAPVSLDSWTHELYTHCLPCIPRLYTCVG